MVCLSNVSLPSKEGSENLKLTKTITTAGKIVIANGNVWQHLVINFSDLLSQGKGT